MAAMSEGQVKRICFLPANKEGRNKGNLKVELCLSCSHLVPNSVVGFHCEQIALNMAWINVNLKVKIYCQNYDVK